MPSPRFQLNSKHVFLTYPQVGDLHHDRVLARLDELGCTEKILGIERHVDGGIHYHVLARWGAALRTRDRRLFDVEGRHPNIQPVRDVPAVYRYVTKDGDVHGSFELHANKRKRDDVFGDACASTSAEQFFGLIKEGCPRDFVIFHKQLETYATKMFKEAVEEYSHPESSNPFDLPDDIAGWVETEFPKVYISLWLYPLTRCAGPIP